MTDQDDTDVDVNLLSELLELAEQDDSNVEVVSPAPVRTSNESQSFDSFLEDLDKIPVKSSSSRGRLVDKTSCFNNQEVSSSSKNDRNCTNIVSVGNADSSDDEDARNGGSSLDSFGSSVKRLLKSEEDEKKSSPRLLDSKTPFQHLPSWKSHGSSSGSRSTSSLCLPDKKKIGPMDVYTDSSIGMRLVNPLVSSTVIKERLVGRKVVSMSQVKQFTSEGKITDDWVIFGAIVSKAPPRTSAKGTTYGIIKLSDLRGPGNPKMVSLFLFSSAFKKHSKDSLGTVLGVLNPGVLENSRNHGDEACLSVDNADRVMILGTSKDFGYCKSKKKNGENCQSIVNTAQCEYCVYHVKQEYQKCSRRSDIQSSFNGPGLTNLRNKVLGKSEVFYGGQSFSAIPAKKNKKLIEKDQNRLMALFGKAAASPSSSLQKTSSKGGFATSLDLGHRQSQKDMDRLRKLILDDGKCLSKPSESSVVNTTFNGENTKPDEAKLAALSVIAKRKGCGGSSPSASCEGGTDFASLEFTTVSEKTLSSASVTKDAAIMSEGKPMSRGLKVTLALGEKKNSGESTPSSLGLGCNSKNQDPVTNSNQSGRKTKTPLAKEAFCKAGRDPSSSVTTPKAKARSQSGTSKKSVQRPLLSSEQLLKLASSGMDLESRMLKQAAQKAAIEEEASKLNANASPSTLGLGRSSIKASLGNKSAPSVVPKLGTMLNSSGIIDLNVPFMKKNANAAKLNAISRIKHQGGIAKKDPNFREFESRKKATKEGEVLKRPSEEPLSTSGVKKFKASEPQGNDEVQAQKARFKELMEKTSRHADLVDAAETEAQEEYFGKLEKKEQMEEKMLNTFKVACKAVRCLTCKYTSFSASELCKTERHPLKVMDATKRFFKCGDCGNRTVCLSVIPLLSCTNCSSSRWERTAMIRERKVGVSQEILSIRGMEETFIGSVTTGKNVNLLVPDSGT